jgi:Tfp pilus assembly protein PilO
VRAPGVIWRQRLWIWVPALLFFLGNVVALAVYFGYAGRVETLQNRLEAQDTQLEDLAAKRKEKEAMLASVRTNEQQVQQLYDERLSSRNQQLTLTMVEVRGLARQAGMVPKAFSYPETEIEDYNLIRRSYVFSVEGTYAELRKFISLVERSKSFLSIDEISLAGTSDGPELRIDVTLSTLYTRDPDAPVTPAPQPAAQPGGAR